MSRLTDLLSQVAKVDGALADDLRREVSVLSDRRPFGLNFERHVPESVQLPRRTIRRGDKVVFRDASGTADRRTWIVIGLEGPGSERQARLLLRAPVEDPQITVAPISDLVAIAEFRDSIYPGLRSTGAVTQGGDRPYHAVINGENYHVLEALSFTCQGQVDCIYIDPPYNTRDNDWKYNNDYVDSNDAYRHSKWLAFMERRLKLARRLLRPDRSVLVVTIDEREIHRLGLLLAQTFGGSKIQMVTAVTNQRGVARGQEFARVDEYAFAVFVGDATVSQGPDDMLTSVETVAKQRVDIWNRLMRRGTDSLRGDSPRQFYPILVDPQKRAIVSVGDPLPLETTRASVEAPEGLVAVWPIRTNGAEGRWTLGADTLRRYVAEGMAKVGAYNQKRDQWSISYLISKDIKRIENGEISVLGRDENGVLELELSTNVGRRKLPRTVWYRDAHNAGTYGSELLGRFLPGRKFPFPKSLYIVEDMLRVFVADKPDALVLDFFAGSGTTAHAIMRLNKQDGGRRRSIIVTNNEVSAKEAATLRSQGFSPGEAEWEALGICEHITKPRIKAAIEGCTPEGKPVQGDYKFLDAFPMADGFEENAEFFDLTYEDPERVRYGLGFEAVAPLLWLRAGSEGARVHTAAEGFQLADTYALLFDLDAAAGFVAAVRDNPLLRLAYVVTDDETQFQVVTDQLPRTVECVRLYASYLDNFRFQVGA